MDSIVIERAASSHNSRSKNSEKNDNGFPTFHNIESKSKISMKPNISKSFKTSVLQNLPIVKEDQNRINKTQTKSGLQILQNIHLFSQKFKFLRFFLLKTSSFLRKFHEIFSVINFLLIIVLYELEYDALSSYLLKTLEAFVLFIYIVTLGFKKFRWYTLIIVGSYIPSIFLDLTNLKNLKIVMLVSLGRFLKFYSIIEFRIYLIFGYCLFFFIQMNIFQFEKIHYLDSVLNGICIASFSYLNYSNAWLILLIYPYILVLLILYFKYDFKEEIVNVNNEFLIFGKFSMKCMYQALQMTKKKDEFEEKKIIMLENTTNDSIYERSLIHEINPTNGILLIGNSDPNNYYFLRKQEITLQNTYTIQISSLISQEENIINESKFWSCLFGNNLTNSVLYRLLLQLFSENGLSRKKSKFSFSSLTLKHINSCRNKLHKIKIPNNLVGKDYKLVSYSLLILNEPILLVRVENKNSVHISSPKYHFQIDDNIIVITRENDPLSIIRTMKGEDFNEKSKMNDLCITEISNLIKTYHKSHSNYSVEKVNGAMPRKQRIVNGEIIPEEYINLVNDDEVQFKFYNHFVIFGDWPYFDDIVKTIRSTSNRPIIFFSEKPFDYLLWSRLQYSCLYFLYGSMKNEKHLAKTYYSYAKKVLIIGTLENWSSDEKCIYLYRNLRGKSPNVKIELFLNDINGIRYLEQKPLEFRENPLLYPVIMSGSVSTKTLYYQILMETFECREFLEFIKDIIGYNNNSNDILNNTCNLLHAFPLNSNFTKNFPSYKDIVLAIKESYPYLLPIGLIKGKAQKESKKKIRAKGVAKMIAHILDTQPAFQEVLNLENFNDEIFILNPQPNENLECIDSILLYGVIGLEEFTSKNDLTSGGSKNYLDNDEPDSVKHEINSNYGIKTSFSGASSGSLIDAQNFHINDELNYNNIRINKEIYKRSNIQMRINLKQKLIKTLQFGIKSIQTLNENYDISSKTQSLGW